MNLFQIFFSPFLGEKWFIHRKIITPTFHFSILESFCEVFSEKSEILVNRLKKYAGTGKPVDVYPFITKAAMDIICGKLKVI